MQINITILYNSSQDQITSLESTSLVSLPASSCGNENTIFFTSLASSWQLYHNFFTSLASSWQLLSKTLDFLPAPGNLCEYFLHFALFLLASSWQVTRPNKSQQRRRGVRGDEKGGTTLRHVCPGDALKITKGTMWSRRKKQHGD